MKLLITLVLFLVSATTWALPVAPFNALEAQNLKSGPKNPGIYNFEGIVKLSNCSGSLVIFNGMPKTAKAVVMTNGHCLEQGDFLKPGEFLLNKTVSRKMRLFNSKMDLFPIKATKVLYATMTKTDVTFYQLDKSYQEIMKETKVSPLTLDALRPSIAQEIEIVSGYWDRGYSCSIDNFVFKLKEDAWTWLDSIRYTDTCATIGGTSGSPILAKGERKVVGINNTGNEDGKECTMNNPCEVSESGTVTVENKASYGQQTYNVYTCLTPAFDFDLTLAGCELTH